MVGLKRWRIILIMDLKRWWIVLMWIYKGRGLFKEVEGYTNVRFKEEIG